MKNYFLSKTKIPNSLPGDIEEVVEELRSLSSQDECLKRAYEIMTSRYRGYRLRTFNRFFQIFTFDLQKLWKKKGFIHCHNANYLMRVLLVGSGFFKNEDIENKWTLIWHISLHQYLRIRQENGKYINVDIWGAHYGYDFGNYVHGFH